MTSPAPQLISSNGPVLGRLLLSRLAFVFVVLTLGFRVTFLIFRVSGQSVPS